MVKLGMTPRQAIVARTKTGVERSRIGSLTGTLEPGAPDVISVAGDPLGDVASLQDAVGTRA